MSSQALLESLPPATDYITYLTIIEYNLTKSTLPTLVNVLQDEELTRSIGWDLINTLLPLLPDSQEALDVIVKLGNPREVVLKVTEALRLLDLDPGDVSDEYDEETSHASEQAQEEVGQKKDIRAMVQMKALLSMLPKLHSRLNTKSPSRFLSTTLQAVLAAFSNVGHGYHQTMYESIATFVKDLRAALSSETTNLEEADMQKRLLQSFLTHMFELYVLLVSGEAGEAAFAWSGKVFERMVPGKVVPGRISITARFEKDGAQYRNAQAENATLRLADELDLDIDVLLRAIMYQPEVDFGTNHDDEEEPPQSANDIPLSAQGSLFLLASTFNRRLSAGDHLGMSNLPIFGVQSTLMSNFIGVPALGGIGSAGSETPSTIDAILALSLLAVVHNCVGTAGSDEDFTSYLQVTSLLSANTPSPNLRYVAHYIISTLLHSHPSDHTRLTFIRDTLEHCPYENLKASAVEWFKTETMNAISNTSNADGDVSNIFATPSALENVAKCLFPDQRGTAREEGEEETWMAFSANLSFLLAALNLYLFLLMSSILRDRLVMTKFHETHNMSENYLKPLRDIIEQLTSSINSGPISRNMDDQDITIARLDVALMDNVLNRLDEKLAELGLS